MVNISNSLKKVIIIKHEIKYQGDPSLRSIAKGFMGSIMTIELRKK